jgi:hypothetical protein
MTMLELDLLLGLIYSFLCLTFLKNPISYVQIDLTSERLYKQALVMKQICKLFPLSRVTVEGQNKDGSSVQYDQICNALLPQGLNPLSVPPKELAASLG